MGCNCGKPITKTECAKLKEFYEDGRLFIYHIFDGRGLEVAYVPSSQNPNEIAKERGFYNEEGELEWYLLSEHPCIRE